MTGGDAAACASPNTAKQIQWVKVQPRHLRRRMFIARSPCDKFCTRRHGSRIQIANAHPASATSEIKTLPSPISPVRADWMMTFAARSAVWSATTESIFFILFPQCHSITQLHLRLAEPHPFSNGGASRGNHQANICKVPNL